MKTLKELRDEKAKEYFVFGLELTPDRYLPMAFKAGFDTALEELSKSAGEADPRTADLTKRANSKECYCTQYDGQCRNHDYQKEDVKFLTDSISYLRLRIAEIEGEK